MTPYTPDTVNFIRNAIGSGMPAVTVMTSLGWDATMFERVCRKHGVDCVVPADQRLDDTRPDVILPASAFKHPSSRGARFVGEVGYLSLNLTLSTMVELKRRGSVQGIALGRVIGVVVADQIGRAETVAVLVSGELGEQRSGTASMIMTPALWRMLDGIAQRRNIKPSNLAAALVERSVRKSK